MRFKKGLSMQQRFRKTPRPLVYKIEDLKNKQLRIEYYRLREVWQTVDPLVFKNRN